MGRKIPGKKHRGIKDPDKQRAQRYAELKTKINAPPKNLDDQDIPKSLKRIISLKEKVKSGKITSIKKRKRTKSKNKLITLGRENPVLHPKAKPEKAVPVFNQRPGESQKVFWNRVNRETHNFINETTFEKKFNVQVKRNTETGEVEGLEKIPKDPMDEFMKLQLKHKNVKKKKKIIDGEPKLSKFQKRKKKLDMKKAKKSEEFINYEPVKEKVAFGEVVHAPPEFTVRPTRAEKIVNKPTKDLLLNSLLKNDDKKKTKQSTTIDKCGKRKNLPSAERRILEKLQSSAIEAYKSLKLRKIKNVDA